MMHGGWVGLRIPSDPMEWNGALTLRRIRRVAALKGERAAEDLASHWEELRGIGMDSAVAEAQERLRARMNDGLSRGLSPMRMGRYG